MFEMSISKALSGSWRERCQQPDLAGNYFFYLIHDGQTTLYIGRTRTPWKRLRQHLALHNKSAQPSKIGQIILDTPRSLDWTITFFTLDEATPLIEQHLSATRYQQLRTDSTCLPTLLSLIEQRLIDKHHPRFNSRPETYDLATPRPDRYRKYP